MKQIYRSDKYKEYNLRRSEKALSRLSKGKTEIVRKSKLSQSNRYFENEVIIAPSYFSVLDNYDESMDFLNKVDSFAWHGRKGYVDLSSVSKISPDAVLYLLSCIDRQQDLHTKPQINGNAPRDEYCRKVFLKSGFYKYVNSSYQHSEDLDVLSVRTNSLISAADAGAVVEYVRRQFKIDRNSMTRATFATIMEAMNNVREHAYEGIHNNRWWLMALFDRNSTRIHFSILDNGRGIPSTVRKKIPDYFMGNDGELIKSSFSGENRSETRLPYRGKGLPKIKALLDKELIRNLRVISRNGFYFGETNTYRNLEREYKGTLISWDFVKEIK
jgi:hypothetical protein